MSASAVVLQFPRSAIVRAVPRGGFPSRWTARHERLYDHLQHCDGLSPQEAWTRVEQDIADELAADSLPPGEDHLLFLARLALSRLPRRKPSEGQRY